MPPWPAGFIRNPDEEWARAPLATLAQKYDRVESHGWYDNLDPTVEELDAWMGDGRVLVDYSGGTLGQTYEVEFAFTIGSRQRTGRQQVIVAKK